MTPQQLTGLAALLLDFRDWLEDQRPGCLDAGLIDAAVDVCANERKRLVNEVAS